MARNVVRSQPASSHQDVSVKFIVIHDLILVDCDMAISFLYNFVASSGSMSTR